MVNAKSLTLKSAPRYSKISAKKSNFTMFNFSTKISLEI